MKKVFLILVLFLVFFALGGVIKVQAGTSENVVGWIWGGSEDANIGTSDGIINGNETGLGFISMNNVDENGQVVGGNTSYGVNIPASDGDLSGYAWSENLGWIDFGNSGCPTGVTGNCQTRRSGNNLAGYALVVSMKYALSAGNSGGWEGFIDLSGVTISGNTLSGYGWSGETVGTGGNSANGFGAINFSGAQIVVPKTLSVSLSADPSIKKSPFDSTMTINITSGTATGNVVEYFLDCTGDGTYEKTYTSNSGEESHQFTCSYSGSGEQSLTARAYAKRGVTTLSLTTSNTAEASILLNPCFCENDADSRKFCTTKIYKNNCGRNCNGTRDCTWKEVAP